MSKATQDPKQFGTRNAGRASKHISDENIIQITEGKYSFSMDLKHAEAWYTHHERERERASEGGSRERAAVRQAGVCGRGLRTAARWFCLERQ